MTTTCRLRAVVADLVCLFVFFFSFLWASVPCRLPCFADWSDEKKSNTQSRILRCAGSRIPGAKKRSAFCCPDARLTFRYRFYPGSAASCLKIRQSQNLSYNPRPSRVRNPIAARIPGTMAPPDGATGKNQTAKTNGSRSVRKPVVPALPITFPQRPASHAAATARAGAVKPESRAALPAKTSSSLTTAAAAHVGEHATKAVSQSQAKAASATSTAAEEKTRDAMAATTTTTRESPAETDKSVSEMNSTSGLEAVTPSVAPVQTVAAAGAPSSLPYHAPGASNGNALGTTFSFPFSPETASLSHSPALSTILFQAWALGRGCHRLDHYAHHD